MDVSQSSQVHTGSAAVEPSVRHSVFRFGFSSLYRTFPASHLCCADAGALNNALLPLLLTMSWISFVRPSRPVQQSHCSGIATAIRTEHLQTERTGDGGSCLLTAAVYLCSLSSWRDVVRCRLIASVVRMLASPAISCVLSGPTSGCRRPLHSSCNGSLCDHLLEARGE